LPVSEHLTDTAWVIVPNHPMPAPAPSVSEVSLRGVGRRFEGGVTVFEGLDLDVPRGQFVAILGPSGCGKSTLLRMVAGLDRPDAGAVRVDGRDPCTQHQRNTAYVFQDAHLLPWRSAVRNVELPLELMGVARAARREAAMHALEQVDLVDAAKRNPLQLSGGMRMRVSLARAMVTQPRLLLLDEPFAALDEMVRLRLDEHLHRVWEQAGMTVLFVTHAISEATLLAQRVVVLSRRPARIVSDRLSALPRERTLDVREQAEFAREQRLHLDALERGGGAV
jgi:NitT/TauT family transport system ATP-binding protein